MSDTITDNLTYCDVSDITFFLDMGMKLKKNIFMLGNPGIGKTQMVHQYLKELAGKLGLEGAETPRLITKVLSSMDRLDFVMQVANQDTKVMEEYVTDWITELSNERNPEGPISILYLNEYNVCNAPALKSVLYRLLEERALGNLTLRDNVQILADGNPPGRGVASGELDWPEKRRLFTLNVVAKREQWLDWAMANSIHPYVIGFLQLPNHFQHFENFSEVERGDQAWANSASWHKLSDSLPQVLPQSNKKFNYINAEGWIGRKAGSAFCAWTELESKIPAIDLFLADPSKFDFGKMEGDVQWFLISHCGMLAVESYQQDSKDRSAIDSVISLAAWLQQNGFMEMSFFLIRYMVGREKSLGRVMSKHPKYLDMAKNIAANPTMIEVMNLCVA